jgi:hypothetical protein
MSPRRAWPSPSSGRGWPRVRRGLLGSPGVEEEEGVEAALRRARAEALAGLLEERAGVLEAVLLCEELDELVEGLGGVGVDLAGALEGVLGVGEGLRAALALVVEGEREPGAGEVPLAEEGAAVADELFEAVAGLFGGRVVADEEEGALDEGVLVLGGVVLEDGVEEVARALVASGGEEASGLEEGGDVGGVEVLCLFEEGGGGGGVAVGPGGAGVEGEQRRGARPPGQGGLCGVEGGGCVSAGDGEVDAGGVEVRGGSLLLVEGGDEVGGGG